MADPNSIDPYTGKSLREKLIHYIMNDSIPAQMVRSAWSGVTLPGDVYAGRVDPLSDEAIGRAADLAGTVTVGAGAIPGHPNDLRMGAYFRRSRNLDTPDNGVGYSMYVANSPESISQYGQNLWRIDDETLPAGAIIDAASSPQFRMRAYRALREAGEDAMNARALVDEAAPGNIVNSAGLWDNLDYTSLMWDRVIDPLGATAVRTPDGLISFDPAHARRVIE